MYLYFLVIISSSSAGLNSATPEQTEEQKSVPTRIL